MEDFSLGPRNEEIKPSVSFMAKDFRKYSRPQAMSLENGELAGLSTRARSEQTSKGRDGSSKETAGRTHV